MFRILSGILTIGNLEFVTDDEGFTRQNFDEENSKKNLSIIAVKTKEKLVRLFVSFLFRICSVSMLN